MTAEIEFPSLSVFFPAYNDAPSLPGLLQQDLRRAASSTWPITKSSW